MRYTIDPSMCSEVELEKYHSINFSIIEFGMINNIIFISSIKFQYLDSVNPFYFKKLVTFKHYILL